MMNELTYYLEEETINKKAKELAKKSLCRDCDFKNLPICGKQSICKRDVNYWIAFLKN